MFASKPDSMPCCETMNQDSKTRYTPLDTGRDEIHIYTIEQGDIDKPVKCSLTVARLSEASYRCLSYVWGSAQDQQIIQLGQLRHTVTRNLDAALRQLWSNGVRSGLWIDALCINQREQAEKSRQVAMMGRIFAELDEVLICLGLAKSAPSTKSESNSRPPMDVAPSVSVDHLVYDVMQSLADDIHFHELQIPGQCRARKCPCPSRNGLDESSGSSSIVAALEVVFDSRWFERACTLQEILLAKKAAIMLEKQILPWDLVSRAWVNMGNHMRSCCSECVFSLPDLDLEAFYRVSDRFLHLAYAKESLEEGQHLIHALLQFSSRVSTNPRDKVYGAWTSIDTHSDASCTRL